MRKIIQIDKGGDTTNPFTPEIESMRFKALPGTRVDQACCFAFDMVLGNGEVGSSVSFVFNGIEVTMKKIST